MMAHGSGKTGREATKTQSNEPLRSMKLKSAAVVDIRNATMSLCQIDSAYLLSPGEKSIEFALK